MFNSPIANYTYQLQEEPTKRQLRQSSNTTTYKKYFSLANAADEMQIRKQVLRMQNNPHSLFLVNFFFLRTPLNVCKRLGKEIVWQTNTLNT